MRNDTQTWLLTAVLIFAGITIALGFPRAWQVLNTFSFQAVLILIGISFAIYIINRKRL
ncbi:MAG: hypothetical protein HPY50_04640 [Firmicutes bacterium]|nr:hypothetical protein [Bacillota bacterium]